MILWLLHLLNYDLKLMRKKIFTFDIIKIYFIMNIFIYIVLLK